jgi:para-aminobenzoate synthetase
MVGDTLRSSKLPRLLIIDHHDSYTHNLLISLLDAVAGPDDNDYKNVDRRKKMSAELVARTLILSHSDPLWQDEEAARKHLLPYFDAVLLSPGPGRPDVEQDFGASNRYLRRMIGTQDETGILPTLGVCLGHQGIALAAGGALRPAKYLRHGLTSSLLVTSNDDGVRWPAIVNRCNVVPPSVTTYNSLVVDESTLSEEIVVTAFANDGPIESTSAVPLERVVMGLQHRRLPLWGVQFHPESIASQGGHTIMRNFLDACSTFWSSQFHEAVRSQARRDSLGIPQWLRARRGNLMVDAWLCNTLTPKVHLKRLHISCQKIGKVSRAQTAHIFRSAFQSEEGESNAPVVWLDSARPGGTHSRYSFMSRPSWIIRYEVQSKVMTIEAEDKCVVMPSDTTPRRTPGIDDKYGLPTPEPSRTNSPEMEMGQGGMAVNSFFERFDRIQNALHASTDYDTADAAQVPFKAGFVGYFGYELKEESLTALRKGVHTISSGSSNYPSAWFGFCDQVLAFDHATDECFALGAIDEEPNRPWQDSQMTATVRSLACLGAKVGTTAKRFARWADHVRRKIDESQNEILLSITRPNLPNLTPRDSADAYKAKVQRARQLIAEGESYELCLTTKFSGRLTMEQSRDHLAVYESLRRRNPAPFAAFLRLGRDVSICCSSPEKFIGIDGHGEVEMKPIKGTVARAGHAAGEAALLHKMRTGDADALRWADSEDERRRAALQCDAKERAENLMIVDLIRRDLLSFCAPESVVVPKLMAVESYETVHQLVTTVHGQKPHNVGPVAAVSRCFPPGSMTGAPKVRSVELLEQLEGQDGQRGVYSGTLGWIGLNGSTIFNVIIRSVCLDGDAISVGAGGAITYHSTPAKEWQEVLDKVGAIANVTV